MLMQESTVGEGWGETMRADQQYVKTSLPMWQAVGASVSGFANRKSSALIRAEDSSRIGGSNISKHICIDHKRSNRDVDGRAERRMANMCSQRMWHASSAHALGVATRNIDSGHRNIL